LITQGADTRQIDQIKEIGDSLIMTQLTSIARYPVKGLTADVLTHVDLAPNKTLPFDRAWAIENGGGVFDASNPTHMKKKHFLMLAGQTELARLKSRFDPVTKTCNISMDEFGPINIQLDNPDSYAPLFEMLAAKLGDQVRGQLRIVHAPDQAMTDIPQPQLSMISTTSVADLATRSDHAIAPTRFRGNLIIEGLPAWQEFGRLGHVIEIGKTRLRIESRIRRCNATSVNLETGRIDIDLPATLYQHFGHTDCGVYLTVLEGGRIAVGDPVRIIP
jgi:uncharacterized protein YcbX